MLVIKKAKNALPAFCIKVSVRFFMVGRFNGDGSPVNDGQGNSEAMASECGEVKP